MKKITNKVHPKCKLILRFDDITAGMNWSNFLYIKDFVSSLGLRSILGVVPDCRDNQLLVDMQRADFFEWVRTWKDQGDTIVQHGTHHVYDSKHSGILSFMKKRSEFAGHSYSMQYDRISYGKEIMCREAVWQPYFMAPSHTFDNNTLKALYNLGFIAITDGYGFYPYVVDNIKLVPQLSARPVNIDFGVQTLCLHTNSMSKTDIKVFFGFLERNVDRFVCFEDLVAEPLVDDMISRILRPASALGLVVIRSSREVFQRLNAIKK